MSAKTYLFSDDNGNTYNLPFEKMMQARDGFVKYRGKLLRRVRDGDIRPTPKVKERTEIVSDAMGFSHLQLGEMREHLQRSGVKGVEFTQDPTEPTFMQVRCSSQKALNQYMKARGFHDQNSRNGSRAMLSERDLQNARELVLRK